MKAIDRIITVLKWLGLMLFGMVVLGLAPLAFLVGLFFIFFRRKIGNALDELGADLKKVAYTLDLLGNVTIFNWLWFWFKKKPGAHFGEIGETISEVLAKNMRTETLTRFGKFWVWIINKIDPGHFDNL